MASTPCRVLILDDEEDVRRSLGDYFEDEGFDTVLCPNAAIALDILHVKHVDACIVDMRLPGMDGNEFIRRASAVFPDLVFFVHTGSTAYSVPADLQEIGLTPNHVFTKPLEDMSVLRDAILTAVSPQ